MGAHRSETLHSAQSGRAQQRMVMRTTRLCVVPGREGSSARRRYETVAAWTGDADDRWSVRVSETGVGVSGDADCMMSVRVSDDGRRRGRVMQTA